MNHKKRGAVKSRSIINMFSPKNTFSSLSPLLVPCKLLGLSPCCADMYKQKVTITKSFLWSLHSTGVFILMITWAYTVWSGKIRELYPDTESELFLAPYFMYYLTTTMQVTICFYLTITLAPKAIKSYLMRLHKIDDCVTAIKVSVHRNTFLSLFASTTVFFFYHATVCFFLTSSDLATVFDYYIISANMMNCMLVYQYVAFVLLIKTRVAYINQEILGITEQFEEICRNMKKKKDDLKVDFKGLFSGPVKERTEIKRGKVFCYKNTSERYELGAVTKSTLHQFYLKQNLRLRSIRKNYCFLCEMTTSTNSAYGFQIMLQMVVIYTGIITNVYSILDEKYNFQFYQIILSDFLAQNIPFSFVVIFQRVVELLAVNISCQMTVNEAALTSSLLNKILLWSPLSSDALIEFHLFEKQLQQNKVKFMACHFFKLGYFFILTMLLGIITFLVILLVLKRDDILE